MQKSATCYLTVCFLSVVGTLTFAQEHTRVAQATMTFLEIGVGARAAGMGSTFNCVDDDASALFWNPAGISRIRGGAVSISQTRWLADMNQYAVAAAFGNSRWGTFGISAMIMDNGDFYRTRPVPADLATNPEGYVFEGTFNVNQYMAGLAYGRRITDRFAFGGQVKYVYQDLGTVDVLIRRSVEEDDIEEDKQNRAGALALDFGTVYYPGFKDLRFAMSFRHFSHSIKYAYESYELPLTFTLGLAGNILGFLGYEGSSHSLQVAVDAIHPRDYGERIHLGAEYVFAGALSLRGGYKFNYDVEGISAGIGLRMKHLNFDYAYTPFEAAFGPVQRLSVGFSL